MKAIRQDVVDIHYFIFFLGILLTVINLKLNLYYPAYEIKC